MKYLDHAATSWPKDSRVVQAVVDGMQWSTPGRGDHALAREAGRRVDQVRRDAARLLGGGAAQDVAFAHSATDALHLALNGCLRPGDHVVTTQVEHNAVLRPLRAMQGAAGLRLEVVPAGRDGTVPWEDVARRVTRRTRAVVLSHASNVTGALFPVAACVDAARRRAPDAWWIVDAAQTAGYRPLHDVQACVDVIAAAGHKGPGGPLGTGLLWVRPGRTLRPVRLGGTGVDSASRRQPPGRPECFEAGSLNVPGILGLGEALRIRLDEQGLETVRDARAAAMRRAWERSRDAMGVSLFGPVDGEREPVLPLRIEGWSPAEAGATLEHAFGIQSRSGLHCAPGMHDALGTSPAGTLRLSFGATPTSEEVDAVFDTLIQLAAAAPRSVSAVAAPRNARHEETG